MNCDVGVAVATKLEVSFPVHHVLSDYLMGSPHLVTRKPILQGVLCFMPTSVLVPNSLMRAEDTYVKRNPALFGCLTGPNPLLGGRFDCLSECSVCFGQRAYEKRARVPSKQCCPHLSLRGDPGPGKTSPTPGGKPLISHR